ncbi:hypothetical protein [Lentibacillus sp. CBA3610]|uniref:hypothetical protein n=1 Tax=Lentibacillus sp. CBA3610 TaxID=2518176 RepID=UPI0020D2506B|nr:hypothetical protein [Lentibacillus sp. CBA3610]
MFQIKTEASQAKNKIITLLDAIHKESADCHLSVKLTQLGMDIDQNFCIENMKDILSAAKRYDICQYRYGDLCTL